MVTILTRKQIKLLIVVCLVLVLGIVGFLSALPQSQPTNLECFDNTLGVVCWELIGTTDRVHRGSPIDANSARVWCVELNSKYPSIRHWVEYRDLPEGDNHGKK